MLDDCYAGGAPSGLQALAARPLQEGRRLRVPPPVRHTEDARVLLLRQIQSATCDLLSLPLISLIH